ncbi:hypothetical protein B0T25DRAFT_344491 [Lasiosphaeria hispida]|uniref:Uncharacterized protein n=1 Tax=Lasiosphaeria hispida TaxID=260671 RepID=A0AAJ0H6G1_9PEZI|nr:hypothetical protein B0T25DRAFT_344491 [Lasiosphaeria hispida]
MDQPHIARRSASHGSLNRSYTANAGIHHPRMAPRSFSRPLRSVNENSSLLASPGPLASMLKTTTETGDIGLFSIRPARAPAAFYGPPRPRPMFSEAGFPRPATSEGIGSSGFRDDRKRLPSYRDTTSEIISMYGSDSQRSASSSFSPPFDDMGHRSYSMTSCSSRPLPNQKSNGTMQSQSSGSMLQRPRSPFPYPTRLKRPGVRPSSPAMTENGGVDYSRMVGIDRVSHRTVHGSYKPMYPPHGRRLANGFNRLGPSGSGYSFSRYEPPFASQFSRGLSSSAPAVWGNRFNSRLDGSTSDQSLRTSSLTSIVDMYRPPSCTPSVQSYPARPYTAGSFYYDYSEDFGHPSEGVAVPPPPLAPIPTRAPSIRRATVLNDGYDIHFLGPNDHNLTTLPELTSSGEAYSDGLGAWVQSQNLPHDSVTDNDGLEPEVQRARFDYEDESLGLQRQHQTPPKERKRPRISGRTSIDSSPSCEESSELLRHPLHDSNVGEAEKKMVGNEETGTATIELRHQAKPDSLVRNEYNPLVCDTRSPVALEISQSPERVGFYRTLPLSHQRKESVSSTLTGHIHRSKSYSIDPGLADLASLVQHLDKAVDSVSRDSIDTSLEPLEQPPGIIAHEILDADEAYLASCLGKFDMLNIRKGDDEKVCGELPRGRGHKRNLAVPKINTSRLTITADLASAPAADRPKSPVLAAQPESPVGRLKLQSSMPRLMKALPPLPSGSTRSDSCIANFSTGGPDLPMRSSPFKMLTIAAPSSRNRGKIEPVFSNESRCVVVHVTEIPESTQEEKTRTDSSSPCRRCARVESEEGRSPSRSDSGDEPRSPRSGNLRLKLKPPKPPYRRNGSQGLRNSPP